MDGAAEQASTRLTTTQPQSAADPCVRSTVVTVVMIVFMSFPYPSPVLSIPSCPYLLSNDLS